VVSGVRRSWLVPAAALLAVLVAGCSGSAVSHRDSLLQIPVPTQVTVQAQSIAGLGTVLTDAQGHALYMFPPDAGSRVSCTGPCAGTWPPLVIAAGHQPTAGTGGINAQDLSTLADPNTGARIVTYGGYPLYRYAGDVTSGTANGQGLFLNGGPWYTLNPNLQPVTTVPSTSP
jgi:predicted lipoprotein with Yx(FWY)xxD motif